MAGLISRLIGLSTARVAAKPMVEQGVAGFTASGGYVHVPETNPDVMGANRWQTAQDILTNISIVAASIRFSLNLVSRPKWHADPPSDKQEAKDMAEFVEEVLNGIDTSWSRIVRRTAMYRYHGFGVHEWVAKKRDDGRIGIESINVRPVHTIRKWDLDENGGINGVVQVAPQNGQEIYLPRQKLVYLVDDAFTDRPDGMGLFRHLADPAQRLRRYLKLETMGFERDLAGIPVGRAPLQRINQLVTDKKLTQKQADQMIASLQNFVKIAAKEPETGLVLDSEPFRAKTETGETISSVMQWGMELITGSASSAAALGEAIRRLMTDMALIIGTEQLLVGTKGEGSRALAEDKSKNLYLTSNATLNDMAESFDRDIVTTLWTLNGFPDELRPKLRTEDVAFKDAVAISQTLANMATAGAILHPNDPAINDLRDIMGISSAPEIDQTTADLMLNAQAGLGNQPNDGSGDGGGAGGGGPDKGGRPSRENPGSTQSDPGGKPTKKFNLNHVPSGADGGQFTSAPTVSGPNGLSDYLTNLAHDPEHHPNVIGLKVDDQSVFHPDKSAMIRREAMPQIPDSHRDAFLATVPNKMEMANPHELFPTQDQIDGYKTGLFATDPSIPFQTPIVSKDNYVIDGHHHWSGAVAKSIIRGNTDPVIPIHRIDLSRDEVLARARSYSAQHGFQNEPLWKYSDSEPRDDRGRWTSGGGPGSFPVQQLTPQQMQDAMRILGGAKFSAYSPRTIADLNAEAGQIDETLDHAPWEAARDLKPWQGVTKYSADQPRDYHGRWSDGGGGSSVLFEVSPNPDHKALADRWNKLSDGEKKAITDKLARQYTPTVLGALGVKGRLEPAVGGFEGEINPSLYLNVDNERSFDVAGAVGDTFGQKAMVVMSDRAGAGLSPVGMVSVIAPGADEAKLRELQGQIGGLADGFTYHDGRMQILNFSGEDNATFAGKVDEALGGNYIVEHAQVYSAYIEEKDYARPQGNAARSAWGQVRGHVRSAFSQSLEEELSKAGT